MRCKQCAIYNYIRRIMRLIDVQMINHTTSCMCRSIDKLPKTHTQ